MRWFKNQKLKKKNTNNIFEKKKDKNPCYSDSFGAAVEKMHFGGSMARIYLASGIFKFNCVTGMSLLFRVI